ncbi:MAG: hypothetical protein KTR13_07420 [Saprospiraceae bacterium]|nr:hypothetical protein [Saprospiraceae bacterium]
MELDDLKSAWQKMGKDNSPIDEQSLKGLTSRESKSFLKKIRKNMFIDVVAGVAAIIFILIMIIQVRHSSLSFPGLALLVVLFLGWIGLAYPRLYKSSQEPPSTGNILAHLNEKITSLEKDLNFYKNLNIYMYPLAVVVGLILDKTTLTAIQEQISNNTVSLLIIILAFAIVFPLYVLFVKWWTNFMYGRFVKRLKDMYNELITDEIEEE